MTTLMTMTQTIPATVQVTAYFPDFISWIDRPEKTTRTYVNNLRQFACWMADNGVETPTRDDIISYRHDLEDRGCKPTTVKAYMQTVKAFFRWTAAAGLYPDVASNVHTPQLTAEHRKDALERTDVLVIESSIRSSADAHLQAAADAAKDTAGRMQRATEQDKRLYAIYLLAVNAGLRTVEISRADVGDLIQRGGQSYLRVQGKGHAEKDVLKGLAPEVAEAIKAYLAARSDACTKDSPLFCATGNRSGGKRLAATTISTMLKKAMQAAGYDDDRLTAHSLRHTAGTAVMEMTGNLYATQSYMRHASPNTTEIYVHVDDQRRDAQTAADLYAYYHG